MKRGSVSANQLKYQAADEAMHIVLATCIGILWNDYGKLHRKKTRLKNFMSLYKKGLETCNQEPSKKQLEAEEAFFKQTDRRIIRREDG